MACLLYFRARYYDPQTGEFISRDLLGYVDGMSQYRAYFVPGGIDPTGMVLGPGDPPSLDEFGRLTGDIPNGVDPFWTKEEVE